jgi:hypothetical protein
LLLNKKLKSPLNIKEQLNKKNPFLILFPFWKVLPNLIKGNKNILANKKLIQE